MIKQIHIKNFKSVQDLKLDLGRVNVFIGANGSGKTNILEAIALAGAYSSDQLNLLELRGMRMPSIAEHYKSAFDYLKSTEFISISIEQSNDSDKIKYEIPLFAIVDQINYNAHEIREPIKDRQDYLKTTKKNINEEDLELAKEEVMKMHGLHRISSLEKFVIYQPEYRILRNLVDETPLRPFGLHGQGLFRELKNFPDNKLQTITEYLKILDWFETFELKGSLGGETVLNIKDRFLVKELQWFDQRSSNEGFLYILFYLTLFLSDRSPSFFAIDNVESTLNPLLSQRLLHSLTDLAKQNNKQAILTTHSASILDGLDIRDDDQRLFVISRNLDGETIADRILPNANENEKSLKLSEKWLRGYIGGLPDNF